MASVTAGPLLALLLIFGGSFIAFWLIVFLAWAHS